MTLESGIPPKIAEPTGSGCWNLEACSLVRDASPPWCFMLDTQHQGLRSLSSLYPLSCYFLPLRSHAVLPPKWFDGRIWSFSAHRTHGTSAVFLCESRVRAKYTKYTNLGTWSTCHFMTRSAFSRPLYSLHFHKCHSWASTMGGRNILSIAQSWGLSLMPSWRGLYLFDKDLWTWKATYLGSSKDRNHMRLARLAPRECCGAEPDRAGSFST